MSSFTHYPALSVELGAVLVLVAALVARILLRRFGVPSIITLLLFGLAVGPSGIGWLRLNLTQPGTRALLSLAVVIVLFEATLRIDLRRTPKLPLALLTLIGSGLTLLILPHLIHAFGFNGPLTVMIASICVVTGPTVTGPLLARLRLRSGLSHLLETEGLALDALGVIIAAVAFASFTSRPGPPLYTAWEATMRIGTGVVVGALLGYLGRRTLPFATRSSSDISKVYVLLLGFSAYAFGEALAHESGLVAVVVCGLMMDFKALPHERLLRSFKEDLSMLALSTVFVLLASQIEVAKLGHLVIPALAITGALVGFRVVAVLIASRAGAYTWHERLLMMTVFPRGIVAVSLATYYATQLPSWGLRGGGVLAGILFIIIIVTIVLSTISAIAVTRLFGLQMPSLIIVGITPSTLDVARRFLDRRLIVLLIDKDDRSVAFARSNDLDAEFAESAAGIVTFARERNARSIIIDDPQRWPDLQAHTFPPHLKIFEYGTSAFPTYPRLDPAVESDLDLVVTQH